MNSQRPRWRLDLKHPGVRRILTVDEDRLRTRAQEAADRIRAKNTAAWTLAAELAPYLSRACRAVAAAPYPVNRYAAPAG